MSICQKAGMIPIQMELGGKVRCLPLLFLAACLSPALWDVIILIQPQVV